MQKPLKQALFCWVVTLAIIVLVLRLLLGSPGTSEGANEAIGRVLAHTGIAAFVTWMIARAKTPPWSWARFCGLYVAVVVIFGLLASSGRAQAAEVLPFTAQFPAEWSSEQLDGLSSAPQDRTAGVRERAQWFGADGIAVIEIACAWRTPDDKLDLQSQLLSITNVMIEGLAGQQLSVDAGQPRRLVAGRDWLAIDLRVFDPAGTKLQQTMAVTATDTCFVVSTYSGTPVAFSLKAREFETTLKRLTLKK